MIIDRNLVIASILWYKMPNQTATAAQIAEIAYWTKEEAQDELEKICHNPKFHTDIGLVVRNNTRPVTYSLKEDINIVTPEHELDKYIYNRKKSQ